jgi:hypothetical protein
MQHPQTWSRLLLGKSQPTSSIAIDPDNVRDGPAGEMAGFDSPDFHANTRPSSGKADRAQLGSFNFPNPLIWVVGSSSVCT